MARSRSRKGLAVLCLVLVPIAGRGQSLPDTLELAYDDGEPVDTLYLGDASLFAMRFSPPAFPVRLLAAKYFLRDTSHGTSFRLSVHEDNSGEPANVLYGPVAVTGGVLGWNELDLRPYNWILERDFHLVFGLDGKSILELGAEDRAPLSGRASLGDCCGWWRASVDLLIRAKIELLPAGLRSGCGAEPPTEFRISAFPNPSNGCISFRIISPEAGWALVVYSVDGRLLRRWDQTGAEGLSRVLFWDGTDLRGREVASGTYLARLVSHGRVLASCKFVVLR